MVLLDPATSVWTRPGGTSVVCGSCHGSDRSPASGHSTQASVREVCEQSGLLVLHNRQWPGTGIRLDHVVVTPTGLWLLQASHTSEPVPPSVDGKQMLLTVAGQVRRKEPAALALTASQVETAIRSQSALVPVHPVIVFAGSPGVANEFLVAERVVVTNPGLFMQRVTAVPVSTGLSLAEGRGLLRLAAELFPPNEEPVTGDMFDADVDPVRSLSDLSPDALVDLAMAGSAPVTSERSRMPLLLLATCFMLVAMLAGGYFFARTFSGRSQGDASLTESTVTSGTGFGNTTEAGINNEATSSTSSGNAAPVTAASVDCSVMSAVPLDVAAALAGRDIQAGLWAPYENSAVVIALRGIGASDVVLAGEGSAFEEVEQWWLVSGEPGDAAEGPYWAYVDADPVVVEAVQSELATALGACFDAE